MASTFIAFCLSLYAGVNEMSSKWIDVTILVFYLLSSLFWFLSAFSDHASLDPEASHQPRDPKTTQRILKAHEASKEKLVLFGFNFFAVTVFFGVALWDSISRSGKLYHPFALLCSSSHFMLHFLHEMIHNTTEEAKAF
jgi:hypothetical protein